MLHIFLNVIIFFFLLHLSSLFWWGKWVNGSYSRHRIQRPVELDQILSLLKELTMMMFNFSWDIRGKFPCLEWLFWAFCKIPRYQVCFPFTFPRTSEQLWWQFNFVMKAVFPGYWLAAEEDGVRSECALATAALSLLPYGLMWENSDLLFFA